MNNSRERSSYKAGDKVRIARIIFTLELENELKTGKLERDRFVQVGEVVTLDDPPTKNINEFSQQMQERFKTHSQKDFILRIQRDDGGVGWIPVEWIEPEAAETASCSCSIITLMAAGCTCGHLRKEVTL